MIDISNRNTVSNKIPEIDSLYIYKTNNSIPFTVNKQEGVGYRYQNHKTIQKGSVGEIYIYHQTAVIDGTENGLTIVTKCSKKMITKKFFKDSINTIKASKDLTAQFKAAESSPTEIGIYYLY